MSAAQPRRSQRTPKPKATLEDAATEDAAEKNPWLVPNLDEFLYYNCPECDHRAKDANVFVEHAVESHVLARNVLVQVKVEDGDMYVGKPEEEAIEKPLPADEGAVEESHNDEPEDSGSSSRAALRSNYDGEWQCYICGQVKAKQKRMVVRHIRANHYPKIKDSMLGPPRDLQCDSCKLMFPTQDALGLHLCGQVPPSWIGVSRGTEKKCNHCEATFSKTYALQRHVAVKHSATKNFPCDECDYKASIPTLLKKHKARVHSDNRDKTHLCNLCASMFMEKTQLWAHITYIHGKSLEETMCFSCGTIIRTNVGMLKHLKEAHSREINRTASNDPSKPYKCESCASEFADIEELREHFRLEHKDLKRKKKLKPKCACPDCGKLFYTKDALEGHHNRHHSKERKYVCPRCPEAFYDSRSLKVHSDQHDGYNQHKCPTCWKLFKNRYLCDRHIKSVHEKSEIYVCDTCGFKTHHAYSLTAHVQQVHEKYRPHKCDFCEDAFFYKRDRDKHTAKAHGAKDNW